MSAADRQTLLGANDMFTSLGVRDHVGAQLKFEAGMRENAELREQVGKLTAELAKACKPRDQFRDALNQKRGKHVCGKWGPMTAAPSSRRCQTTSPWH
ncbi:MAG: hypothetical protein JO045_25945 [Mycobacterium sp.]|nr:hypothetical protein [Mycobacterium sp.]